MTTLNDQAWLSYYRQVSSMIHRPLESREKEQFRQYASLLLKWNQAYNLIGRSTEAQILERHFMDCIPLCSFLDPDATILDIGSGAGFPGVVLAISTPSSTRVVLVESAGKKARFLSHLIRHLGLEDRCQVFHERVEDHRLPFEHGYDFVVSRAVGTLSLLAELSLPRLKSGGMCLALKGEKAEEEIHQFLQRPVSHGYEPPECHDIEMIENGRIVLLRKKE